MAAGSGALASDTTGARNLRVGYQSLSNDTTGDLNVAVGYTAGQNVTTGSNNVDIANTGVAGDARTIRIGTDGSQTRAFLGGVYGVTPAGVTQTVVMNSNGQLGTVASAARGGTTGSASDRLMAEINSQQAELKAQGRQIAKLGAEVTQLRKQTAAR